MSQVLILGDVHLGKSANLSKSTIGANLNSRIEDQLNLLDWTLETAHDSLVSDIIITGDVFEDPKPHPSLITLFISWLKKCEIYDINVHIIMGNHDVLRNGFIYTSPLDILTEVELHNVHVYKDLNTIFIGSTAFTLIPFRDRKSFAVQTNSEALNLLKESIVYELASIPQTYKKVVVGHLVIEGSIPVGDEIDDITNELFCPVDMFNGYDYVWMGHVHKPQIMKKNNPFVAHIGSMDISNFGETEQKKYVVIFDAIQDGSYKLENEIWGIRYLPTRQMKKISITVPQETEDTTKYILEQLKNNDNLDNSIVKVEISLSSPELQSANKSVIEKYLSSKGVFNVAGILESKKINVVKKDNNNVLDTKMDVASAIKIYSDTYINEEEREKFIELSMDIYSTYKAEKE